MQQSSRLTARDRLQLAPILPTATWRSHQSGFAPEPRGGPARNRLLHIVGSLLIVLSIIAPLLDATAATGRPVDRPERPSFAAQTTTDEVVLAAGDIAVCGRTQDEATGNRIESEPGTVLALGDLAYENGTTAEFNNCYDPAWGSFKDRTFPAPGNHEYHTSGAAGYFGYWGARAGDPTKGYYSFDLGAWHVISLNSNCAAIGGCGAGSAQEQWLRADLAAHPNTCILAYWHHPRFSSGMHGNDTRTQALFQALYDFRADVVLTGHDHTYERFAPQDATGRADSAGIREFVVGTGGRNLYNLSSRKANSEIFHNQSFGVLRLVLRPTGYTWEFLAVLGSTFTDSGSASCSGSTAPTPTSTATRTPTATPSRTPSNTPLPATMTATATASPTPTVEPITNVTFPVRASFYLPSYPAYWTRNGIFPYTRYNPTLGFYDLDAADVSTHIAQMQYGKIEVGIASWWGQASHEDQKLPLLLEQATGTGFTWTVYYEPEAFGNPSVEQIQEDLAYLTTQYGAHSNTAKINGRMVIFVRNAGDTSCTTVDRWTQANTVNVYLVMKVFPGYTGCINQPDGWHQYAPAVRTDRQGNYSFSISPGFYHVQEAAARLARDPAAWAQAIRAMVASGADWQLVTTFNEWGEGTSVEPATEWDSASGHGIYLDLLHTDGAGPIPPTSTPAATGTPSPTATGTATLVPPRTATPATTATPAATSTATAIPTTTATPTSTSTATLVPTFTVTPTSTPAAGTLFSDGFESGDLSRWASSSGLTVQQGIVASDAWAARGTSTGRSAAWARANLASSQNEVYARVRFYVASKDNRELTLLRLETGTNAWILTVYVNPVNYLAIRRGPTAALSSGTPVSLGAWHELIVRLRVNGSSGESEVWLDGTRVDMLSMTADFGTVPVARVEVGESATVKTFDVALDDVAVSTSAIASSGVHFAAEISSSQVEAPTLAATETPSATVTATATAAPTETPQPTATDTPVPTATATLEPTVTATAEPTATDAPVPTATDTLEPTATATLEPLTSTATEEPPTEPVPTANEATAADTGEPVAYPIAQTSRSKNTVAGTSAIDGDPATEWRTKDGADLNRPAILTLDVGAAVPIDRLIILAGASGLAGVVTIETSNDGENWAYFGAPSPSRAGEEPWLSVERDPGLPEPVSARYVRIVCVNGGADATLGGIAEVVVLGPGNA